MFARLVLPLEVFIIGGLLAYSSTFLPNDGTATVSILIGIVGAIAAIVALGFVALWPVALLIDVWRRMARGTQLGDAIFRSLQGSS